MAAAKKTVKPIAVASKATSDTAPKTDAKKAETPVAETKVEKPVEVKKEPVKKETVKKEPVKKEAVKKEPAKKAPAKKAAVKKAPVKKTAAKKAELKSELQVQFTGKDGTPKTYSYEDLVKIARDVWKYDLEQKEANLTSVKLYVKPEEDRVYYIMDNENEENKVFTGSFGI